MVGTLLGIGSFFIHDPYFLLRWRFCIGSLCYKLCFSFMNRNIHLPQASPHTGIMILAVELKTGLETVGTL